MNEKAHDPSKGNPKRVQIDMTVSEFYKNFVPREHYECLEEQHFEGMDELKQRYENERRREGSRLLKDLFLMIASIIGTGIFVLYFI